MFIFLLFQIIFAKRIFQQFSIRQLQKSNWLYIGKFGAHIGHSEYSIIAEMVNMPQEEQSFTLEYQVYLDEDWDQVLARDECDRQSLSRKTMHQILYPENNHATDPYQSSLGQEVRQHMWFFAINNCDKKINVKNFTRQMKLQITIHITNTDGSEFSSEESGFLGNIALLTIANIIAFVYYFRLLKSDHNKNQEWDWLFFVLIIIIGLEVFGNLCLLLHLMRYSSDGSGFATLKVISELVSVLSNFTLSCLFILIAWGWSIEFLDIADYDLYLPLAAIIAMIQMLILGLGKLTSDYAYYHQFDGVVGYFIILINGLLFAYFYYCCGQRKKKGEAIDQFYNYFKIYASLFFLSTPILILISKIIAPYLSYKLIMIGTTSGRLISVFLFLRLVTYKNSSYRMICYKNKAFLDRR